MILYYNIYYHLVVLQQPMEKFPFRLEPHAPYYIKKLQTKRSPADDAVRIQHGLVISNKFKNNFFLSPRTVYSWGLHITTPLLVIIHILVSSLTNSPNIGKVLGK